MRFTITVVCLLRGLPDVPRVQSVDNGEVQSVCEAEVVFTWQYFPKFHHHRSSVGCDTGDVLAELKAKVHQLALQKIRALFCWHRAVTTCNTETPHVAFAVNSHAHVVTIFQGRVLVDSKGEPLSLRQFFGQLRLHVTLQAGTVPENTPADHVMMGLKVFIPFSSH